MSHDAFKYANLQNNGKKLIEKKIKLFLLNANIFNISIVGVQRSRKVQSGWLQNKKTKSFNMGNTVLIFLFSKLFIRIKVDKNNK